jgi:hypothetical protein
MPFPGNHADAKASHPDSVKIPAKDPTPPLAVLDVVGGDTTLILTIGMEPEAVELSTEDTLVLIALGEDGDGGVKDLSLTGSARVSCRDPVTGKASGKTTGFQRRSVSGSYRRILGPVRKTSRFVLRPADFAALCPGHGITGLVGQVSVSTVNFRGGYAAGPRLEFRLPGAAALALAARFPPAVTQAIPPPTGSGYGPGTGSLGGSGFAGAAEGAGFCPRSDSPSFPAGKIRQVEAFRETPISGAATRSPAAPIYFGPPVPPSPACAEAPVPFVSPKARAAAPNGRRNGPVAEPQANPKTPSSPIPREARI